MNHLRPCFVRGRHQHDTGTVDRAVVADQIRGVVPLPLVAVDCDGRAVEIDAAIEFPLARLGRRAAELLDGRAKILGKWANLNRRFDRLAADIK